MPEIITRAEAKARGLKRYFTGRPCAHGHVSQRRIYSGECWECHNIRTKSRYRTNPEAKAKRNERRKALRATEAGKLKRAQEALTRKRNLGKRRLINRDYYRKHREKEKRRKLDYYYQGPSNPKGEMQWLRKNRAQLRTLRRTLRNLGASPSPNEV